MANGEIEKLKSITVVMKNEDQFRQSVKYLKKYAAEPKRRNVNFVRTTDEYESKLIAHYGSSFDKLDYFE